MDPRTPLAQHNVQNIRTPMRTHANTQRRQQESSGDILNCEAHLRAHGRARPGGCKLRKLAEITNIYRNRCKPERAPAAPTRAPGARASFWTLPTITKRLARKQKQVPRITHQNQLLHPQNSEPMHPWNLLGNAPCRQTDRQTDRRTNKQTSKQTNRQK